MKTLLVILLHLGLMDNVDIFVPSHFQPQVKQTTIENQWSTNVLSVTQNETRFLNEMVSEYQPQWSTLEPDITPMQSPTRHQGSSQNNYGLLPEEVKLRSNSIKRRKRKRVYPSRSFANHRSPILQHVIGWKGTRPISMS